MMLIVGLGNPGEEYEKNRHNAGRIILEHIAAANDFSDWKNDMKTKSLRSKGEIKKEKFEFMEPETFMNNSGNAVAHVIDGHRVRHIAHDEADEALLRIWTLGTVDHVGKSAGQNGAQVEQDHEAAGRPGDPDHVLGGVTTERARGRLDLGRLQAHHLTHFVDQQAHRLARLRRREQDARAAPAGRLGQAQFSAQTQHGDE